VKNKQVNGKRRRLRRGDWVVLTSDFAGFGALFKRGDLARVCGPGAEGKLVLDFWIRPGIPQPIPKCLRKVSKKTATRYQTNPSYEITTPEH
jgi:hypothetical protein